MYVTVSVRSLAARLFVIVPSGEIVPMRCPRTGLLGGAQGIQRPVSQGENK